MAITLFDEKGWLTREADVGGDPVLRVDLDAYAADDIQFTEAGSGVGTDPLTTDANGHLYLAGKKHSRNGTTSDGFIPATGVMELVLIEEPPGLQVGGIAIGIGGGTAAFHF